MKTADQIEVLLWRAVPDEAVRLAEKAASSYHAIRDNMAALPDIGATIWFNPDDHKAIMRHNEDADSEKVAAWFIAIRQAEGVDSLEHGHDVLPPPHEPYMRIKSAIDAPTVFGPIASVAQFNENPVNRLWGGPNPMAATLGGGLLGAGAGYGAGWLLEQLLPEEYVAPGKLRRTTSVLGGLTGALPGALWAINNIRHGPDMPWYKSIFSNYPGTGTTPPLDMRDPRYTAEKLWTIGAAKRDKLTPEMQNLIDAPGRVKNARAGLESVLKADVAELNENWIKATKNAAHEWGDVSIRDIPVDMFNRAVWNDLRPYGGNTDPAIAAATTGLVQAASLSQGGINLVSPLDIAKIGVGAGSGYLSGLVVGKTIGALAGLKPNAQQALQRAGIWAGVLSNVVPMAFSGS